MYTTRYVERRLVTMSVALAGLLLTVLLFSTLYLAGCTDTLDGDTFENQKPIVYFANIPPEGQRTGRNLEVFWYGTDRDGLIDYFRYHVAKVNEVDKTPEDYILTVPDSEWVFIDVDPSLSDPHTKNTIVLSADLNDPVNSFVSQWIFLQAFDMEGLGSDIVFRLFSRNDYPPQTVIRDFSLDVPFVDGEPGGVVTGVKLSWVGSDQVDYPGGDFPPMEFQWRLYGPYTDSVFQQLVDSFIASVFVGRDGKVYNIGDTALFCDTFPGDSIVCETIPVMDTTGASAFGQMEDKFFVDDPNFIDNTTFNKIADSSFDGLDSWVFNTRTTIYNVYRNHHSDTTVEMMFMFWIQSRDDAFVADLIPAYDSFSVISPRYERDVAVIDFAGSPPLAVVLPPNQVRWAYWKQVIENWKPGVVFDTTGISGVDGTSPDYLRKIGEVPLRMLLKHKVVILYDDNMMTANFPSSSSNVYKAIEAGVNVWLTMRAPLVPGQGTYKAPIWEGISIPLDYLRYFGVRKMVYSGWFCHAITPCVSAELAECDAGRIEDFVGTYALDSLEWPNLSIDTALLRTQFRWSPISVWDSCLSYDPEHPGLPCVDWSVRMPQTEVLYLYKSFYGSNHPRGGNYNMEGNPVAHRLATSLYRTAHFHFTPLAMQPDNMQIIINKILDWLYDPTLSTPTSTVRYPDAPVKVSIAEARKRYLKRNEELAQKRAMFLLK